MRRFIAFVLAIAAFGCGTPTTQSDVPQPSPSPVRANEFQQKPGDYQVPGTPVPTPPVIGGGNGGGISSGSGGNGGSYPQCSGIAPSRPCGKATARCTDLTYSCAQSTSAACTTSAIDCVYCPGPLCTSN